MITNRILISLKSADIQIIGHIIRICLRTHIIAHDSIGRCHVAEAADLRHTILYHTILGRRWFHPFAGVLTDFRIFTLYLCNNFSEIQCSRRSWLISSSEIMGRGKGRLIHHFVIPVSRTQSPVSCTPVIQYNLHIMCRCCQRTFLFQMERLCLFLHQCRGAVIFISNLQIQLRLFAQLLFCNLFIHIDESRILSLRGIAHGK